MFTKTITNILFVTKRFTVTLQFIKQLLKFNFIVYYKSVLQILHIHYKIPSNLLNSISKIITLQFAEFNSNNTTEILINLIRSVEVERNRVSKH